MHWFHLLLHWWPVHMPSRLSLLVPDRYEHVSSLHLLQSL
jgi:hypothetical protein